MTESKKESEAGASDALKKIYPALLFLSRVVDFRISNVKLCATGKVNAVDALKQHDQSVAGTPDHDGRTVSPEDLEFSFNCSFDSLSMNFEQSEPPKDLLEVNLKLSNFLMGGWSLPQSSNLVPPKLQPSTAPSYAAPAIPSLGPTSLKLAVPETSASISLGSLPFVQIFDFDFDTSLNVTGGLEEIRGLRVLITRVLPTRRTECAKSASELPPTSRCASIYRTPLESCRIRTCEHSDRASRGCSLC